MDISGGTYRIDENTAVEIPDFTLMKYEASVFQFGLCVTHGKCPLVSFVTEEHCNSLNKSYNTDNPAVIKDERGTYPMNCAKYEGAEAFCKWLGGRLPTEYEWEYAAYAGRDDALYPWGNDTPIQCHHANFTDPNSDTWCSEIGILPSTDELGRPYSPEQYTQFVNLYPDGQTPTGLFNMAGNLAEYTQGVNLVIGPSSDYSCDNYILKGGSYASSPDQLTIRSRLILTECGYTHNISYAQVGFRCLFER